MAKNTAEYGAWRSPIEPARLFDKPAAPFYPTRHGDAWYWLESRPQEGGRLVLVRRDDDDRQCCVTPAEFNIRTRVHEYGGKCFAIGEQSLYFSNYSDQRLYRQPLLEAAEPQPLTPAAAGAGGQYMFADLRLTPDGGFLLCVCEHERDGRENENLLVAVPTMPEAIDEPCVLVRGHDFYANLVVSDDGARLAWVQWAHPNMPWDDTELALADLRTSGTPRVVNARVVAGGLGQCVCQAGFTSSGDLFFALDRDDAGEACNDFWNLYMYRDGRIRRLTCDTKEYGGPHWVFGETRHAVLGPDTLIAVRTGEGGDELVRIDVERGTVEQIASPYAGFTQLQATARDTTVMVASAVDRPPAILELAARGEALRVVNQADSLLGAGDISIAETIRYPTRDGEHAYGFFYRPRNAAFDAPADTLPPLLVMVHGGPTSRAAPTLDLTRQYWTTLGFAVFDVNHRGSTGYGRRYRQDLLGEWGERDAADIVDGVEHLARGGLIDRDKVFIRGRSAGGYAVLRVLTRFAEYFAAGACYFGIGNLVTLCETTHKFEARYTDRLVGEVFEPNRARTTESVYYQRSPINYINQLRSPMILFQGTEDRVVPPDVTREVVAALRRAGLEHEYVEYPGEGHGFRGSETNIDALRRETAFFRRVMGL